MEDHPVFWLHQMVLNVLLLALTDLHLLFSISFQCDSLMARMLFASLFQGVFGQVDCVFTDHEAETTKKAVRDGLNAVVASSTTFYPPFIGSLLVDHDLSLSFID